MTPRRRLIWMGVAMVLGATALGLLLRPLRRERPFHVPDPVEARAAGAMFAAALAPGAPDARHLAGEAPRYGLALGRLADTRGLSFAEPDGQCTGRGTYLVRTDSSRIGAAIIAPHRGADRDTGPLAQLLFAEHPFAATAWNSAPRHAGTNCDYAGDVTRYSTHYMTAFSLAFAQAYPHGRVVQLHGFDRDKRQELAARGADAIVSDGSREPSAGLLAFAECLRRSFPERSIAVYPRDTEELGATINAQGQALRAAHFDGFVHLEMSADFRRELVANRAARAQLAACIEPAV